MKKESTEEQKEIRRLRAVNRRLRARIEAMADRLDGLESDYQLLNESNLRLQGEYFTFKDKFRDLIEWANKP